MSTRAEVRKPTCIGPCHHSSLPCEAHRAALWVPAGSALKTHHQSQNHGGHGPRRMIKYVQERHVSKEEKRDPGAAYIVAPARNWSLLQVGVSESLSAADSCLDVFVREEVGAKLAKALFSRNELTSCPCFVSDLCTVL